MTWGYDWHLDVEPTLLAIAQRNGHAWQSGSLVYFDKPIADTHRRRLAGVAIPSRSSAASIARRRLTPEEIDAAIAQGMAEWEAEKRNDSG